MSITHHLVYRAVRLSHPLAGYLALLEIALVRVSPVRGNVDRFLVGNRRDHPHRQNHVGTRSNVEFDGLWFNVLRISRAAQDYVKIATILREAVGLHVLVGRTSA